MQAQLRLVDQIFQCCLLPYMSLNVKQIPVYAVKLSYSCQDLLKIGSVSTSYQTEVLLYELWS